MAIHDSEIIQGAQYTLQSESEFLDVLISGDSLMPGDTLKLCNTHPKMPTIMK